MYIYLKAEVTNIHMVLTYVSVSGWEEAECWVERFSKLMVGSVKHSRLHCWKLLQHSHGLSIIKQNTALLKVYKHSHPVRCCPGCRDRKRHVSIVVPGREVPFLKLEAPWAPVPSKFGSFVPPSSLYAAISHAHRPCWTAVHIHLPIVLTRLNGKTAQGTV